MEESIEYYTNKLDLEKKTGKLFSIIPLPKGLRILFAISTLLIVSFIESIFNTFFILPLLGIFLCIEHYYIILLRQDILDMCILEEILLENDLIANKDSKELIDEPKYIIELDRISIFEDRISYETGNVSIFRKIKNHYWFFSFVVILYFILYFIFILLNN